MKNLLHAPVGGCCCFLRIAAVPTRAQIGRVPISPVMLSVRLLKMVMVLRTLTQELCKGRDVRVWCALHVLRGAAPNRQGPWYFQAILKAEVYDKGRQKLH